MTCRTRILMTATAWLALMAGAVIAGQDEQAGGIPVRFSLDEPGYVTLVVEHKNGERVRNLINNTHFEAGDHTLWWDGYDVGKKKGKKYTFDVIRHLVEPGTYRVRGIVHGEMGLNYIASAQAPGSPPWFTADRSGGWLADHTPPSGMLFLPDGSPHGDQPQMMVSAPTGEAGHSVIWLDMKGTKLWGGKIRGWKSGKLNAHDTGEEASSRHYAYSLVDKMLYGLRRGADEPRNMYDELMQLDAPEVPEGAQEWNWLEVSARQDMAVHNRSLVISFARANRLVVVKLPDDGCKTEVVATIKLDDPRGLAFDRRGRLYCVSGKRVLRYDDARLVEGELGQPRVVIGPGELADPGRLIVEPDNRLYVADLGECHQVRVYDAAGQLSHAIGKPGGPQYGLYDETRMARPAGMAVDDRGRLWVAELDYGPKRISRWDARTGAFDRAWYGPPKYGGGGQPDPRNPARHFYSSGIQGIEFIIDLENDTSRPRSIYWRKGHSAGRCPGTSVYRDGRHYMVNTFCGASYFTKSSGDVYLYDESRGVAERVAHVGRPPGKEDLPDKYLGVKMDDHPELKAKIVREAYQGHKKSRFLIWSDLNRDGKPSVDEVQATNFGMKPVRRDFGGVTFARDLSITTTKDVHIAAPTFNDHGVPVWKLDEWTSFAGGHGEFLSDVINANDGMFIYTMGGYSSARVTRGFRSGELVWKINGWGGPGRPDPIAKQPGDLINAQRNIGFPFTPTAGEAGQCFILNGNHGSLYMLTTDGLFVTDLGGDQRTHPVLSYPEAEPGMMVRNVSFKGEHFWPAVVQMADGSVRVRAGKESDSLFELAGAETIRRIGPWAVQVKPDQLAGMPAMKIIPGGLRKIEKTGEIQLVDSAPKLDGQLDEWSDAAWMTIDAQLDVHAAVRVHEGMLYAAWRTDDPKLLANDAGDGWPYAFATGGGLDLMLRTRADSNENKPIEGDVRLFVTRLNDPVTGSVLAVRYQQVGGEGRSIQYTSPVGQVQFDSVRDISTQVRLAQHNGTYELAVPLDVLGLDGVKPGLITRGDVGVLIGDGSETRRRVYWHNRSAQMTSDIPSEARLVPAEWGRWMLVEAGKPGSRAATERAPGVLFDEKTDRLWSEKEISLLEPEGGAFSGRRAAAVSGLVSARPGRWPYPIRQNPGEGQYRYLKFAWKPQNPGKIRLKVMVQGSEVLNAEHMVSAEGLLKEKEDGEEPGEEILGELQMETGTKEGGTGEAEGWRVERIDLWKTWEQPRPVTSVMFRINGGQILLDDLRLSRERK
ncbi:MAG: hypothetical protein ACLFWL_09665 [Candidatus Brocadiia bacterium]